SPGHAVLMDWREQPASWRAPIDAPPPFRRMSTGTREPRRPKWTGWRRRSHPLVFEDPLLERRQTVPWPLRESRPTRPGMGGWRQASAGLLLTPAEQQRGGPD